MTNPNCGHYHRKTVLGLFALIIGLFASSSVLSLAANPIKLGVLEDQSGDFAVATICKVHAIQLATDEINGKGGIAGRPLGAGDL